MKKLIAFSLIAFVSITSVFAQNDAYSTDIKNYFRAAKFDVLYAQTIDNMVDAMKNVNDANLTDEEWEKVRKEMKNRSIEELFDKLVPIYKKHFTHEEIKAFLKFYQSPAGKKYAEKTSIVMNESLFAAEEWGKDIAKDLKIEVDKYD